MVPRVMPFIMEDISFNIHHYDGYVVLEVITDNGAGNVSARSVEFNLVDTDREKLVPQGELPPSREADIQEYLQNAGYTLAERQTA